MENYYKKQTGPINQLLFHLCVIEMLIFSGEMRFSYSILGNRIQMPLFLLTSFLFYIGTVKSKAIFKKNILTITFLMIWVFLSCFIFNSYTVKFSWARFIFYPLSTFLIISACDFYEFRNLFLKYLTILSAVSIIIQLGHDYMYLFPTKNYYFENRDHYLSLGFFVTEWGKNRLASIYWEPGQYQIILNFTLCLFIDELSDIRNIKRIVRKFGVIIIALFMTISTTGYMTFAIIILAVLLNAEISRKWIFSYLTFLIVVIALNFFIYNSQAIQEKIDQRLSYNETTSYSIRVADNIALLKCTKEKPIFGYGAGSQELDNRLTDYGNVTSSNGWLKGSAQLGVPYVLFIILCIFMNMKKMYKIKMPLLILIALVLSQSGEASLYFPYLYMYTFSFLSYSNNSFPNYIQLNQRKSPLHRYNYSLHT